MSQGLNPEEATWVGGTGAERGSEGLSQFHPLPRPGADDRGLLLFGAPRRGVFILTLADSSQTLRKYKKPVNGLH